jgi:hypothetical protein
MRKDDVCRAKAGIAVRVSNDPYALGYESREKGLRISNNPGRNKEERQLWRDGWIEADGELSAPAWRR